MSERRRSTRTNLDILVNKYIDGYPYACKTIDISRNGVLIERMQEPETSRETFPVQVGLPGGSDPIWIWARAVRNQGRRQALRFVSIDPYDRVLLNQFVDAKAKRRVA